MSTSIYYGPEALSRLFYQEQKSGPHKLLLMLDDFDAEQLDSLGEDASFMSRQCLKVSQEMSYLLSECIVELDELVSSNIGDSINTLIGMHNNFDILSDYIKDRKKELKATEQIVKVDNGLEQ